MPALRILGLMQLKIANYEKAALRAYKRIIPVLFENMLLYTAIFSMNGSISSAIISASPIIVSPPISPTKVPSKIPLKIPSEITPPTPEITAPPEAQNQASTVRLMAVPLANGITKEINIPLCQDDVDLDEIDLTLDWLNPSVKEDKRPIANEAVSTTNILSTA